MASEKAVKDQLERQL